MSDPTTEFFERLEARGYEPALERASGTVRFDLTDDDRPAARWLITVKRGVVAVSHRNVKADCVVRADKKLFDGIATGNVNPMAALLRGAMHLEGDPGILVLFQRLFPPPPRRES
jgi:putative sterol carrier protein